MRSIDFYNSFINTYGNFNNVQFSVSSYCSITDLKTNIKKKFYHCSSMRTENTYGLEGLFKKNGYDFTVIFGEKVFKYIRSGIYKKDELHKYCIYRSTPPGKNKYKKRIRKKESYCLENNETIKDIINKRKRILGRTIIRDKNKKAVIEYPIKCFNYDIHNKRWQVDTGPIIFPILTEIKEDNENCYIRSLKLSNIIFNSMMDEVEVSIESPLRIDEKYICCYNEIMRQKSVNKLIVCK